MLKMIVSAVIAAIVVGFAADWICTYFNILNGGARSLAIAAVSGISAVMTALYVFAEDYRPMR
jgi:hypothetical protein